VCSSDLLAQRRLVMSEDGSQVPGMFIPRLFWQCLFFF